MSASPCLASLAFLAFTASAAAQSLPPGFVLEPIGSEWNAPVGLCYLDAHRLFVAERAGRVWYVVDDQRRNLVLDVASEVLTNGDRGLLGIAAPADFDLSGWLYLLLAVDVQGDDLAPHAFSRLIRVRTVLDGADGRVALPETRETLLGDTWSTGIPSCHLSHTIGALHFLSDGSLVLTAGDNAHYNGVDSGGRDPACFTSGRTPLDQDLGAFRAQYDSSLCGKVLRLDPESGRGLADNPYFTGDPDDLLSRVWARGLRNPFRSTTIPGTGPREALFIADVGWDTWEEIDLCTGGENFGWPCFEGAAAQTQYASADSHGLCPPAQGVTAPALAWHHNQTVTGFVGNCAAGLCVYTGQRYPEIYRGRLFFCDYGQGWLRAAHLDPDFHVESVAQFGSGFSGPVELVAQPGSGDLVLAEVLGGVRRLRYVGSGRPPTARVLGSQTFGPGDLVVTLDGSGSSDPDGQELEYAWDLGDGSSASGAHVVHGYGGTANYTARLTVTDTEGLSDSTELSITPANTPPRILDVQSPHEGQLFVPDEPLQLAATAFDAEDGVPVSATWTLDLVHDHHVHPDWASASGLATMLTPDSHGPGDNHFRVRLRVTDARGSSDERTLEIYDGGSLPSPHLVALEETRPRAGQALHPVGHLDWSLGRVAERQASLIWDWGDGTSDVYRGARHQEDTHPAHVYAAPGRYKLRLIAELGDARRESLATIEVAPARPAVAIFAPLDLAVWVERAQQEEIVAHLTGVLAARTSAVRAYALGQGHSLASWMESMVDDSFPDVLVLLDFVPADLIEGGYPGSLLERWIAGGNGIVWSGTTPFVELLADDGSRATSSGLADQMFDATAPMIVQGIGQQHPTPLGAQVVPSLALYSAVRALRYDQLGPAWHVSRVFAEDRDADSDDLEVAHAGGGFYAQFLCDSRQTFPRAQVLGEYLLDVLGQTRLPRASAHGASQAGH